MDINNSNEKLEYDRPNYAGFLRRLFSYLIDVVCFNILVVIVRLYFGVFSALFKFPSINLNTQLLIINRLIDYFSYVLYFTFFCYFFSTSPGKHLLGLTILTEENKKPNLFASILRSLLQPFSMLLFGIGYVGMIKNPKKQAWHEKIAKTVTVISRKPRNTVKIILFYFLVVASMIAFLIVVIPIKNNYFR